MELLPEKGVRATMLEKALTFLLESIQGAVKDVMKLDGVLLHAGHDIVASVRLYEQGIVLRERRMGQRQRIERVSRDPTRRLGPRLERPWAVVCLPLDPQPQRTRT